MFVFVYMFAGSRRGQVLPSVVEAALWGDWATFTWDEDDNGGDLADAFADATEDELADGIVDTMGDATAVTFEDTNEDSLSDASEYVSADGIQDAIGDATADTFEDTDEDSFSDASADGIGDTSGDSEMVEDPDVVAFRVAVAVAVASATAPPPTIPLPVLRLPLTSGATVTAYDSLALTQLGLESVQGVGVPHERLQRGGLSAGTGRSRAVAQRSLLLVCTALWCFRIARFFPACRWLRPIPRLVRSLGNSSSRPWTSRSGRRTITSSEAPRPQRTKRRGDRPPKTGGAWLEQLGHTVWSCVTTDRYLSCRWVPHDKGRRIGRESD